MGSSWAQAIDHLEFVFNQSRWQDLVDVVLVWFIVYKILVLIRRTGTVQMLSGLGVLAIGYIGSIWLELFTFNWLLEKFFSNLFVIVVILFQAEIRRALAHIGSNPFFTDVSAVQETQIVEEIAKGLVQTAQNGFGGLVVVEREILVDYHIEMGTEMDAKVSAGLITSIFHPAAPMHDGAVLIRGGKLHSAGCFLPLSKNPVLDIAPPSASPRKLMRLSLSSAKKTVPLESCSPGSCSPTRIWVKSARPCTRPMV